MFMDQILVQSNNAWSISPGWNFGGFAGEAFSWSFYAGSRPITSSRKSYAMGWLGKEQTNENQRL
jgi:hypothetical protein